MTRKLSEITPQRIRDAVVRRVKDLPHKWHWNHSLQAQINRERLTQYKNKHKGKRCFVMGNGPSLGKMDLSFLKDEYTFGMNRVYLMFPQWGFTPTYYTCINELVLEQFAPEIQKLNIPKFLNWNSREWYDHEDEQTSFLRCRLTLQDTFSTDPCHFIDSGGTVTYACLQLAYFMGFEKVYLIGVDHSFVEKGTPNKTEVRTQEVDESHCHPDYFPKGIKWQLPDLYRSEQAYRLAKQAFQKDGRMIYDATVGGKLTVFEKRDFFALFPSNKTH